MWIKSLRMWINSLRIFDNFFLSVHILASLARADSITTISVHVLASLCVESLVLRPTSCLGRSWFSEPAQHQRKIHGHVCYYLADQRWPVQSQLKLSSRTPVNIDSLKEQLTNTWFNRSTCRGAHGGALFVLLTLVSSVDNWLMQQMSDRISDQGPVSCRLLSG